MTAADSFVQAVQALPQRLRQEALSLPAGDRARAEELRLRAGWPMTAVLPEGERPLGGPPVEGRELEQLVEIASRASLHTVLDQVRRGYLTFEGGHRIGLCGTAAVISPVGKVVDHGREICFPSGMAEMGPVTRKLYDTLTGIQMGRIEAPEGWIHVIE